jgi:hypothetical protein
MPPPDAAAVSVATKALRDEATIWDTQSKTLGEIGPKVEDLRMTRVEAGLFQVIYGEYHKAIDLVKARTEEGVKETTEVANTLRTVADTYDREDAAGEHRMRNVY